MATIDLKPFCTCCYDSSDCTDSTCNDYWTSNTPTAKVSGFSGGVGTQCTRFNGGPNSFSGGLGSGSWGDGDGLFACGAADNYLEGRGFCFDDAPISTDGITYNSSVRIAVFEGSLKGAIDVACVLSAFAGLVLIYGAIYAVTVNAADTCHAFRTIIDGGLTFNSGNLLCDSSNGTCTIGSVSVTIS